MRKVKQSSFKTDVYKLLANTRMGESDRRAAINALQDAETIADGIMWIKEKFEALGHYFLKPSLRH